MSQIPDNPNFPEIKQEVMNDPSGIGKTAAENAVKVATSIAKLGMPGEDNTQLSRDLFQANLAQIEQVQRMLGLPTDLPFQNGKYEPPEVPENPLAAQAALAKGEAAADMGVASGKVGYTLTKEALDESTAPSVFPLIGVSAAAITEGCVSYRATDVAALAANETAKIEYDVANKK